MKIKRGKESWSFIYSVYGILLAIFTFLISVAPFFWLMRVVAFVITAVLLGWLCFANAWFQNKLVGLKTKLEDTLRKI